MLELSKFQILHSGMPYITTLDCISIVKYEIHEHSAVVPHV